MINNKTANEIEYETSGRFGYGKISLSPKKTREIEIIWKGKPPLFTTSAQVDLESLRCQTLPSAIDKACHSLGFLPTFQLETYQGPKALVSAYYTKTAEEKGYATITKKGCKNLKFSLNRIDLKGMLCTTTKQALKKAAFVTGIIKLSNKTQKVS